MTTNNPIINETEKPMTTEKIHFTQEKETMLMTLYSRAMQSQWKNPILPEQWAKDAVHRIDYLAASEPTFNKGLVLSGRMA